MHRNLKLFLSILLLLVTAVSFYFSRNLQQQNPETLFLTQDSIEAYKSFHKRAPEWSMVVFKFLEPIGKYDQVDTVLKLKTSEFDIIGSKELNPFAGILPEQITQAIHLSGKDYFAFIIRAKQTDASFGNMLKTVIPEFENYHYEVAGIPYTNYLIDHYSGIIKSRLFPILFGVAFVLLLFMTRSFRTSFLLFIPALASAIHTLSSIQWLYGTMNMVTSTLPLIAFTINLSLALHLFYSLSEFPNLKEVLHYKWQPIVLMIVTTSIGFGSLYISSIQVIRDFAKVACFIIILTAGFTTLWISLWDSFLQRKAQYNPLGFIRESWFHHAIPGRWIYILSLGMVLLGCWTYPHIPVLTDATRYFPESSHLKSQIDDVSETVLGIPVFDILIPGNVDLDQAIRTIENTRFSQPYKILASNALLSFPASFIPDPLRFLKDNWTTQGEQRILLLGKANNYDSYYQDLEILRTTLGSEKFETNGLYYHLMMSQKAMIGVLYKSLMTSVIIVAFLAFLYTREIKVLAIFLFVNLVPALISISLLYWMKSSINIATVMTFSIAMGVIVDSTFHMLHALRSEQLNHRTFVNTTVLPILLSSVLFVICFGIFMLDDFVPIHQFGQNLSIILLLGLIFDLFVLPTLYLGHHHLLRAFDE